MSGWVLLGVFLFCVVFGEALFVTIGALSLLAFNFITTYPVDPGWLQRSSPVILAMTELTRSEVLIAIPLFTLAGTIMTHGGISGRLIDITRALVGWLPGGMGMACVVACAFFAAISGSSSVTIIAIGGILYPALKKEGYGEAFALGLITVCGAIGTLLPPSLPLIVYGVIASNAVTAGKPAIADLFIAGLIPSLLTIAALCAFAGVFGLLKGVPRHPFSLRELAAKARRGFFALLMPVILLGAIYGGWATVHETSAIAVVYALVVEVFVHREVAFRQLARIFVETITLVGSILIILVAALAFTTFIVDGKYADRATQRMRYDTVFDREYYERYVGEIVSDTPEGVTIQTTEGETIQVARENVGDVTHPLVRSRLGFLVAVNILLLIVGCIMDIFSGIVVLAPLIVPMAAAYHVNLVHLGVIFAMNLELGFVTPPFGINLFISQSFFRKPMLRVVGAALPYLGIVLAVLAAVSYWDRLSLWLLETAPR